MTLLNVNQVAEQLNVKPKTVREYIRQGRLAAVNLNPEGLRPVWRIKPAALEEMQSDRAEEIYLDARRRMGL
jgi:excisionase family DNA binding protein